MAASHASSPSMASSAPLTPSDDSKPSAQPSHLSLIDMALPWLEQLPVEGSFGDSDDLALLRTCTFMRDQVLRRRALRAVFQLSSKPGNVRASQVQELLLAIKYSKNVHLVLGYPCEARCQSYEARTAAACALLSVTVTAAGHPLDAILSVDMTGMMLDVVLPSWLVEACPQMETLALYDCELFVKRPTWGTESAAGSSTATAGTITAAGPIPAASIPGFAGLQNLEVGRGIIPVNFPTPLSRMAATPRAISRTSAKPPGPSVLLAWQRQLNSLTALTSLTLHNRPQLLSGCPNLLTHLTHLSLPGVHVRDQDMEALLSMHRLTRLKCGGFELQQSYSDRPCSWMHLEVNGLDVEQLDCLPLDGLTSIQALADVFIPSTNLAACTRVAAIVAKCGGIRTFRDLFFDFMDEDVADYTARIAALLPMLAPSKSGALTLAHVPITPGLLSSLGQHLSRRGLNRVEFTQDCDWAPDAWPAVLPNLPSVSYVSLKGYLDGGTCEANITAMCVAATRPVKVDLCVRAHGNIPAGFEERVAAAMAAAGHQHVELSVDWTELADVHDLYDEPSDFYYESD